MTEEEDKKDEEVKEIKTLSINVSEGIASTEALSE